MCRVKAGDRVSKDKVVKSIDPKGTVEKVTTDYVVVVWDDINGYWHYTKEQAKSLSIISEKA